MEGGGWGKVVLPWGGFWLVGSGTCQAMGANGPTSSQVFSQPTHCAQLYGLRFHVASCRLMDQMRTPMTLVLFSTYGELRCEYRWHFPAILSTALLHCPSILEMSQMKVIGYTTSIILGTTQFAGGKEPWVFVARVSTM